MKRSFLRLPSRVLVPGALLAALSLWASPSAPDAKPLLSEDFSTTELGAVPGHFMVLEGDFAVRQESENRFLELPGAPLDSFTVLFGPSQREDLGAQARFFGTFKGRKYPAFALSVNGYGGYRLMVAPAKRAIEILKGDEIRATRPFTWENASWTQLRIQIRKVHDNAWRIEGKAWKDGTPEPAEWTITLEESENPPPGRPAVWGFPYSGTPIRFDDLKVWPAEKP